MRYLVMEARPGYAIVMDTKGCFQKVVNLNYETGQYVDTVISFEAQDQIRRKSSMRKTFATVAAAACFCLVLLGAYVQILLPQGTVRMKINPDVMLTVNRHNYVVDLDGLNEDGEMLIEDYNFFWKKVEVVSDELADMAVEMGYLTEGGEIQLFVESRHEDWKVATEDLLITELTIHLEEKVHVVTVTEEDDDEDDSDVSRAQEDDIIIIAPDATSSTGNQALDDSDYGPDNDGVTDYDGNDSDESDYGPSSDGVTDYDDMVSDDGDSNYGSDDVSDDGNSNYGSGSYDTGDDSDDGNSDYSSGSSSSDGGNSNYSSGSSSSDDGNSNYSSGSSGSDDGNSNYNSGSSGSDDGNSNYDSDDD